MVENFENGYVGQEHADNMMSALKIYCDNITTDWEGKLYCGITINGNILKVTRHINDQICKVSFTPIQS